VKSCGIFVRARGVYLKVESKGRGSRVKVESRE
jgi:hypothetical protein